MSTAGAHAGAYDAGVAVVENLPERTTAVVAGMKRRLREVRELCEARPGEPFAGEVLAILDREG